MTIKRITKVARLFMSNLDEISNEIINEGDLKTLYETLSKFVGKGIEIPKLGERRQATRIQNTMSSYNKHQGMALEIKHLKSVGRYKTAGHKELILKDLIRNKEYKQEILDILK